MGNQYNVKILGSADCVVHIISCNPVGKFSRFGNLHGIFGGGLIFGPGIFWGFVGSPRYFFGF